MSIQWMKKPQRTRSRNYGEKYQPYGQHFPTCRALPEMKRIGYRPRSPKPKNSVRNLDNILRNSLKAPKLRLGILPTDVLIK